MEILLWLLCTFLRLLSVKLNLYADAFPREMFFVFDEKKKNWIGL